MALVEKIEKAKANKRRTAMTEVQTVGITGSEEAVEQAIAQVERLYKAMTGREAPAEQATYAPIPVETDPARYVEEQMDRLVQALGGTAAAQTSPAWIPAMTVWEGEREIVVCMDLPGMKREHVQIQVQGNVLTVRGEPTPPAHEGLRLWMSERPWGSFRRSVLIPGASRSAEPSAQMRDGLLEIRILREAAEPVPTKTVAVS